MLHVEFDRHEVGVLISMLNSKGIHYLIGEGVLLSAEEEHIDAVALIQRLATCNYPLVESATISLFLLHPEFASSAVAALQASAGQIAENIAVLILATLYLQQWWLFRLTFALGQLPSFPEAPFVALWEERHLPAPAQGYGLDGLLALQEYEQQRYGLPLNFHHEWQNQINHFLAQEEAYQRLLSDDLIQVLKQMSLYGEIYEQRLDNMNMSQRIGKQEIEQFLADVGCLRQSGQLYLVGGAALVHAGIRPGQTLDIDLQITVDPANLTVQIAQLKQRLSMNIEFASPADFMPLPSQWETRSQFIKRYNQVDAFYFDWYSIALSKMERSSRLDIADVQLLIRQGFVDVAELDVLYREVLNKIGQPPYDRLLPNLSQQKFAQNYQAVRQIL